MTYVGLSTPVSCCQSIRGLIEKKKRKKKSNNNYLLRRNVNKYKQETTWMIMETFLHVRGSKGVEADVNVEEKPFWGKETMKDFENKNLQSRFNRRREER